MIARCPDCLLKTRDTAVVTYGVAGGVTDGVPVGLFQTPVTSLGGAVRYTQLPAGKGVLDDLPKIKAANARVSINLTGGGACTLDATGQFQYALWEACHDAAALPYRDRITAYTDSGTINDNYILDEPNHPSRWGPRGVTQQQIEQMCAHSKALFPRLPCAVRAAPSWLRQAPITYVALDGAWAQYRYGRGPIEEYVREHAEGARVLGLWLGLALNVLDGGDGSSGIIRSRTAGGAPLYEMTGAEVIRYGVVMLAARPCVMGGFRHDETWLNRPGTRSALDSLARLGASQPRDCA